ncbi:MAG: hypothetical protein H7147_01465 [Frankiaceae bacterium]|nr:hypothetical protein [Arenimonas sp.]
MLVVKPKQAAPVAGIKPFTNNYGPRVGFEFTIMKNIRRNLRATIVYQQ